MKSQNLFLRWVILFLFFMEVNYNSFSRGYWGESDYCGLLIFYERISRMEFFMVRIRIKFYLASSFFYIITISVSMVNEFNCFGVRFRCNSSPRLRPNRQPQAPSLGRDWIHFCMSSMGKWSSFLGTIPWVWRSLWRWEC